MLTDTAIATALVWFHLIGLAVAVAMLARSEGR